MCVSKAELTGAEEVQAKLAADLGREVLLISAVTGQGLATLVGRVSQMLAEIKRAEAEEAAPKKPTEFATEAAIRTDDFRPPGRASPRPRGRAVTPDVVVDIGNSRMKWGRCADGRVAEMVVACRSTIRDAWAEQAGAVETDSRGFSGPSRA